MVHRSEFLQNVKEMPVLFAHKSLHVGKNNATMPKEPKGHEQGNKYDISFLLTSSNSPSRLIS